MKKSIFFQPIEILPPLILLIGFASIIYHLPLALITIFISGPLALVISVLQNVFRKDKSNLASKLILGVTNATWLFYISIRILFWSNSGIVWLITIVLSIITFILCINKRQIIVLQKSILALNIFIGTFLMLCPNSQLYYNTRLGKSAKEYPEDYGPEAWDMYSWYLYNEKKYDDALDANALAKFSYKSYEKRWRVLDSSYFKLLEENKQKIEFRTWNKYKKP